MIDDLIDLAYEFDAIEVTYVYKDPITDPDRQLTQVHSESKVKISDEVLMIIDTKIEKIRNSLIK